MSPESYDTTSNHAHKDTRTARINHVGIAVLAAQVSLRGLSDSAQELALALDPAATESGAPTQAGRHLSRVAKRSADCAKFNAASPSGRARQLDAGMSEPRLARQTERAVQRQWE